MCFCFDGESAVVAYLPDECRERLPASARALRSDTYSGEPATKALLVRPNLAMPDTKGVALTV